MSKITALIGLARSGKSTFAREWESESDPEGYTRLVLNCDNVRLALHGHRWIGKAEPMVHATYGVMINALMLNHKLHILLDDTHTTISSIRNVLNLDPNAEFVYIQCPLEEAKERAVKTGQKDLFPVIDRMYKNLQYLAGYHGDNGGIRFNFDKTDVYRSIEKIREEVKKVKEYSDRSV